MVDLGHTLADEVRYRRACLRQVLRQVHAERGHLARQPLVTALDRQRLHTLLVAGQAALPGRGGDGRVELVSASTTQAGPDSRQIHT